MDESLDRVRNENLREEVLRLVLYDQNAQLLHIETRKIVAAAYVQHTQTAIHAYHKDSSLYLRCFETLLFWSE